LSVFAAAQPIEEFIRGHYGDIGKGKVLQVVGQEQAVHIDGGLQKGSVGAVRVYHGIDRLWYDFLSDLPDDVEKRYGLTLSRFVGLNR
jgi:hypothetical protein